MTVKARGQALAMAAASRLHQLPDGSEAEFSESGYLRTRERFQRELIVDVTSLTPAAARVLLAIGGHAGRSGARLVVIGAYQGLFAAWMQAGTETPLDIALVDPDRDALNRAVDNLDRLEVRPKAVVPVGRGWRDWDGLADWVRHDGVVFVDLDDPTTGKWDYLDVLEMFLTTATAPSWCVFHDTCLPRFADVGGGVRELAMSRTAPHAVLPVDTCGMTVVAHPTSLTDPEKDL